MGFALWIDGDLAWAQGTHEYRPMGVAVVGSGCVFVGRDFQARRPALPRYDARFVGLFASIGEMNDYLAGRRSQPLGKIRRRRASRALPLV